MAEKKAGEGVADQQQNEGLKHTAGGVTTRDDANDLGVPMQAGKPDEPVGPEDALGVDATRGDYTKRIGPDNYQPHESVIAEDGGVRLEAQRNRDGAQA